jgi:hypothetical protein
MEQQRVYHEVATKVSTFLGKASPLCLNMTVIKTKCKLSLSVFTLNLHLFYLPNFLRKLVSKNLNKTLFWYFVQHRVLILSG